VERIALDASVLLALLQRSDAHHDDARALLEGHRSDTQYVIGASVYAEILVRAHSRARVAETDTFLDRLHVDVVPVDRHLARRAAALRAGGRPPVKLADALSLAVALVREPPLRFVTFDDVLRRRYEAELEA
jgi:predicted nucleic acid-binding protein